MSTHQPIQKEHEDRMMAIGQVIEEIFDMKNQNLGFALLIFDLEAPGRMNYASNGCREDMLCALKELIARFEGRHIEETQTKNPEVAQ